MSVRHASPGTERDHTEQRNDHRGVSDDLFNCLEQNGLLRFSSAKLGAQLSTGHHGWAEIEADEICQNCDTVRSED